MSMTARQSRMAGTNVDRRQWLRRVGRAVILSGIGALSFVFWRRQVNADCLAPQSPCDTCGVFGHCALPRAHETRRRVAASAKGV